MVNMINRRGFLGAVVGAATSVTTSVILFGCGFDARRNDGDMGGSCFCDTTRTIEDKICKYEKDLQCDIWYFGKAIEFKGYGTSQLAEHAAEAREAYDIKGLNQAQKERIGWVAKRYTNLVALGSLVRDIPSAPPSFPSIVQDLDIFLDDLVRLHVAEKITTNEDAREELKKRIKSYEKAYEAANDGHKIEDKNYETGPAKAIKDKILNQHLLNPLYEQATKSDPVGWSLGVAWGLLSHASPLDDLKYAFDNRNVPKPGEGKGQTKGKRDYESYLYKVLIGRFEDGIFEYFRRHKDLGEVVAFHNTVWERDHRVDIDISGVDEWVAEYNLSIASKGSDEKSKEAQYLKDLEKARYVNKALSLAVLDEIHYDDAQRERLREIKGRLQTGLAWKEFEGAEGTYQKYKGTAIGDDITADTHLVNVMAKSLAAYVLATDASDREIFRNLWESYDEKLSEMKKTEEGRETIRDAYIKALYPYIDELEDLNKQAGDKLLVGSLKTAAATYSVFNIIGAGASGGAGAAGSTLSLTGGFI